MLLFSASTLFANGYKVPFQAQKNNGLGHAGTALALDAAVNFFNPGGISFVEGNNITFGAFGVGLNYVYKNPNTGHVERDENAIQTPFHIYGKFGFKNEKLKDLSLGFGVYTPYGSTINYNPDWEGRFLTTKFALTTLFIQTTASYKVKDKLGIGLGFIVGLGSFEVERAIPVDDGMNEASINLSASDIGMGFQAGLMYQATDEIMVGLKYMSRSKVATTSGEAVFSNVPESAEFLLSDTKFSAGLTTPETFAFGISYTLNKTLFTADIIYTNWAVYDQLHFVFEDEINGSNEMILPRNYEGALTYRGGVQHEFNKYFTLRLGAFYDFTAAPDCCITPETPGSDKYGYTAGASIYPFEKMSVDLSLQQFFGKQRSSTNEQANFPAIYKTGALAVGGGFSFYF